MDGNNCVTDDDKLLFAAAATATTTTTATTISQTKLVQTKKSVFRQLPMTG